MRDRRAFRGLPLAGAAGAGVVLGHWLTYLIAVPNANLRTAFLTESGHGYWPIAVKSAVALALAGMAILTLRLAAGGPGEEQPRSRVFAGLLWRLSLAQVVAFAVLELSERLAAGLPMANLFQHHVFLLGVVIQLALAVAGALLLVGWRRAVVRILTALRAVPRAIRVVWVAPSVEPARRSAVAEPGLGRAPPSF